MTARLRAVTEATELEMLRTVASALVTRSAPRTRLNNIARAGLLQALAEADRVLVAAHRHESLGAPAGAGFHTVRDRTRRHLERAFTAVLVDATRLHDRLARADLTPEETQRELDHAVQLREGCRVNVQGRWWTLTTYAQTVLGSGRKRAAIYGVIDRD